MRDSIMSSLAHKPDHKPSPHEQIKLYEIALLMKRAKLSEAFIASSITAALEFEGIADLLKIWRDEKNKNERNEVLADIQELLDDCSQTKVEKFPNVKINDLDAIASDVRAFKDSLLEIVNQKGGITHLAKLTGIPQPSLSRFFNSNAMPRRATLIKIAVALDLDSVTINSVWLR